MLIKSLRKYFVLSTFSIDFIQKKCLVGITLDGNLFQLYARKLSFEKVLVRLRLFYWLQRSQFRQYPKFSGCGSCIGKNAYASRMDSVPRVRRVLRYYRLYDPDVLYLRNAVQVCLIIFFQSSNTITVWLELKMYENETWSRKKIILYSTHKIMRCVR